MDSLVFLCARRVVAHHPLPALPTRLYPVIFQAAFWDGRTLVLQDLVATWPFPELNLQRLLGRPELLPRDSCNKSVKAVIQGVVAQLRQVLEEPGRHSSLRVLDMTILRDSKSWHVLTTMDLWCSSEDLAKACVEVFKHQQEFQWCRSKQHKSCSGADTATAALQSPGVDIHADLRVTWRSYGIMRCALQTGATSLLRLKCREFQAENIPGLDIVTLLESLDPSCLRRMDLSCNRLGLAGLPWILSCLPRFPQLRSLKLQYNNMDVQHLTRESAMTIHCVARRLGMLPSLQELNLGFSQFSGNLHQILCNLQAPLESLELPSCDLLPTDLAFISQSIHAPALKRLDLSGQDISQGLLEPLRLLLEETSASLLHLDLTNCHMADSHLVVLLPTLLRCSRLRFLGLYRNPLSTATLKDLLQKTLELLDLHLVVYPVPQDCYKPGRLGFSWNSVVDEEILSAAKAEISQLLANSGRTDLVWIDDPFCNQALDYFSL